MFVVEYGREEWRLTTFSVLVKVEIQNLHLMRQEAAQNNQNYSWNFLVFIEYKQSREMSENKNI